MRYAILKAGTAPRFMRERSGDFDAMFLRLLAEPGQQWDVHDVEHDSFPPHLDAYDGYVITGGPASAYDDEPWLHRLAALLRDLHARRTPVLGICLGAQAVAQALGGAVGPNPLGWEMGVVAVTPTPQGRQRQPFAGGPVPLHILETHQDIVTRLPPGALHLGTSPRTPHEVFTVGEGMVCLQGHPELEPADVAGLIERRRDRGLLEATRAEAMLASLALAPDRTFLCNWLRAFLREGHLPASA